MKKILFSFVLTVCVLGICLAPDMTSAQTTTTGIAQLSQCSGTDCSACNVVHLANGVIKWLIGILFVVCACILAYAGVRLVTGGGNSHARDEVKGMFTNVLIGFLIILSAWLIVDTIMRTLVGTPEHPGQLVMNGSATGWLFWSDVQCQELYVPIDNGQEVLNYDLPEGAIDQGTGNAGQVTISTPAGPQVVDISSCDTSQLVSVSFLGRSVTINKQFAASAGRIDAAWRAKGGNNFYRVTSVGGYNCRKIAGSNAWSNHAYGVAIDINPVQNPHTRPGSSNYGQTDMPADFVALFTREGWGWGGNWNSSKDTMHFSKATGEQGNMRGG